MTDNAELEGPRERVYHGGLRELADAYHEVQRLRISMGNRKAAVEAKKDSLPPGEGQLWTLLEERLREQEDRIAKDLPEAVLDHPIGPWLMAVKGIGPTLAAKLIAYIGDARRFSTPSKLWRYAGYAVIDGKAERMIRGERAHFSPILKVALYNVATSFLKTESPYRALYDGAYEYYLRERPQWSGCRSCHSDLGECKAPKVHSKLSARSKTTGWNTGRVSQAAKRKMLKVFLVNLWEAWYRMLGTTIPVRPYVIDDPSGRLKAQGEVHTTHYQPERFVDYELPPAVFEKP
jgi:hypothetical protein